jgi:hypothetical protein
MGESNSVIIRKAYDDFARDPPPQRSDPSISPKNHGRIITAAQRFHTARVINGPDGPEIRLPPKAEQTAPAIASGQFAN